MVREIPDQLWKRLTSTIGLVTVRDGDAVNLMAAEWTYFVNKKPLYVAVVLSPASATRGLLTAGAGEFGVTLCSDGQAELADFAGSFSLSEVDKSSSELVRFGDPVETGTPWVDGGLLALECRLREVVEFPVHHMYVGEVVAAHLPEAERSPLVKHGPMHALGAPVRRTAVVAAARYVAPDVLRVAATGPAADPDEWRVTLLDRDGLEHDLGAHPSAEYGDFTVDLRLPPSLTDGQEARIRVDRTGAKSGYARPAPWRSA